MTRVASYVAAGCALLANAGCGLSSVPGSAGGQVAVVAAENSWGSIAAQVGGRHVHVTSIIVNPATDPHSYEAKPEDARTIARARYVVANGAGYDAWVPRLLAANPVPRRDVLTVGELVGRHAGDNPHFWYSPTYVITVVDRMVADLQKIDPADAAYFGDQGTAFKTGALREYTATLEAIRQKYAGVPIGATENIFTYAAEATGLRLVTPPSYMKAVSDGSDPSAADKVTVTRQVAMKDVRVLVFNAQNTTPDVNALVEQARRVQVPVVAVTETLTPSTASFQDWQAGQLKALLAALGG